MGSRRRLVVAAVLVGAIGLYTLIHSFAASPITVTQGAPRAIGQDFMGFNIGNGYAPPWSDPSLASALDQIHPQTLRGIIGGTPANYYNWQTGQYFIASKNPTLQYVKPTLPNPPFPLSNYVNALKSTKAAGIFNLNIMTYCPADNANPASTDKAGANCTQAEACGPHPSDYVSNCTNTDYTWGLDYQIAMLKAVQNMGIQIKYLELGNELYMTQNSDYTYYFPSPQAYVNKANAWIPVLKQDFPGVKISVVGQPQNVSQETDWNKTVINGVHGEDAITFHTYYSSQIPDGGTVTDPQNLAVMLSKAATTKYNAMRNYQLSLLPSGVDAWITEWNLWSDNMQIEHGSWAQGLTEADYALDLVREPRIKLAVNHSLISQQIYGSLFSGTNGYALTAEGGKSIGTPSPLPTTQTLGKTAGGFALSALERSLNGASDTADLSFSDNPNIANTTVPGIKGQSFTVGGKTNLYLVNLSDQDATLQLGGLAGYYSGLQYASSPSNFVTGDASIPATRFTATDTVNVPAYSVTSLLAATPPTDTQTSASPAVAVTAPYPNIKVSGRVPLAANASDASGIAKVEFYADNVLIATDTGYPYTAFWNATAASPGQHTISAKAYSQAGSALTSSVTVDVPDNPPPAPQNPLDGNVQLALPNPGTPFAASSPWNTPLPASTPLNPNNTTYVNTILGELAKQPSGPNGSLSSSQWSAPMYVVPAGQPKVPVNLYCSDGSDAGGKPGFVSNILSGGIPIPPNAHSAAGTDETITIYQPSTDTEWEFWRLQKDSNGGWVACWGGRIDHVSQSSGIFPFPYGSSATGLPHLGTVARIEELQAGQIDHVMNLTLPNSIADTIILNRNVLPANIPGATNSYSWPANRTDGKSTNSLSIPEGTRFRLPADLDLSQYNLSPVAKTIAIAAKKYGFVVVDGGGGVSIRTGDPTTYTAAGYADPYIQLFGADYLSPYKVMNNFPWDKLQTLPYDYGKPDSSGGTGGSSDTGAPSAPANLSATATSSTTVTLSWSASTDSGTNASGVAKYDVLRNGVVVAQPSVTSYTDAGLNSGTAYSYTVQAVDAAGNVSANSNTAVANTPAALDTTPPSTPTGLRASAVATTQIDLSWSASTDTGGSGLRGYNVYRDGTKLNGGIITTASYGDSTVNPGTAYSYRIEAVDGAGNASVKTDAVSVTTANAIRGDVTGPIGAPDGAIDLRDMSYLIRNYNTQNQAADISGPSGQPDGKVDLFDLSYVIRNYGN